MGYGNLIGQVLDEKYRIERQLGQGGMGSVYFATHLGTGRPVALKVIAPQLDAEEEFIARFRREAKAAGRMRHPNVVDVTDFGFAHVDGGRLAYLVMEYLDGCSLGEVLAEESKLPIVWVVDILEQTCSAVDAAHQYGTIHRDLKPDNIWLEPNRRGGYTVKVLDFGLAKLGGADLPESDQQPMVSDNESYDAGRNSLAKLAIVEPSTPADLELNDRTQSQLQTGEGSSEEMTTLVQHPSSEDQTMILVDTAEPSPAVESDTQLLPAEAVESSPSSDGSGHTVKQRRAPDTAPIAGLTHIGSILGTPLYMSPEQCRGETLDGRSDIYSIGVIGYHMLAGDPPFRGDSLQLLRQHIESPPPPLREKRSKIPKRMTALIMSALAKDKTERPATAEGFASALRASSEGTGALFRRAFALYIEHFPIFFRVSLLAFLPVIGFRIVQLVLTVLANKGAIPAGVGRVATVGLELLVTLLTFLASAVVVGITIRLVTQLFLAPLRPLEAGPAYKALKKRLKSILFVAFLASCISFLRLFLFIIPGVIYYIDSSLAVPVVMMEDLRGRAAIRRSRELVRRSRGTVIAILVIQYLIPILVQSLLAVLVNIPSIIQAAREGGRSGSGVAVNFGRDELVSRITALTASFTSIFIVPLIAGLAALLYLKTRQLGGETLRRALSVFEDEDAPTSNWQKRIRERLHMPTPTTR